MASKELERAKKKAFRLLSYRPRTEFEIIMRLKQSGFSDKVIAELMGFLKKYHLVDDRAFAEEWVCYRLKNRPKGRRYLYLELINKGVSSKLAAQAVNSVSDEEEYNIAMRQAKSKLKKGYSWPAVGRYLERQGFSGQIIYKVYRFLTGESMDEET